MIRRTSNATSAINPASPLTSIVTAAGVEGAFRGTRSYRVINAAVDHATRSTVHVTMPDEGRAATSSCGAALVLPVMIARRSSLTATEGLRCGAPARSILALVTVFALR